MPTKKQKEKVLAEALYLKGGMKKGEIAEYVGVAAKTITAWAQEGNWDMIRASEMITPQKARDATQKLYHMTAQRLLEKAEAGEEIENAGDELSKLANAMKAFDNKTSLPEVIGVLKEFLQYVADNRGTESETFYKFMAKWQRKFIQSKAGIE